MFAKEKLRAENSLEKLPVRLHDFPAGRTRTDWMARFGKFSLNRGKNYLPRNWGWMFPGKYHQLLLDGMVVVNFPNIQCLDDSDYVERHWSSWLVKWAFASGIDRKFSPFARTCLENQLDAFPPFDCNHQSIRAKLKIGKLLTFVNIIIIDFTYVNDIITDHIYS